MERYLEPQVQRDLQKKMVWVAGPRQVGKTTLAKRILGKESRGYLNWDITRHRDAILRGLLPATDMWVFDELHKYRRWRNYLKGVYDEYGKQKRILVTGSARLEHFRRGGDSLQGRYFYLRLHPLSLAELKVDDADTLQALLQLGGFPEPFFGGSQSEARRWSLEYRERLIRDEIASLERISDLGQLELLMQRLPALVGSPLSINALREDLQVSHKTMSRWLNILENTYAIFRLPPFGAPRIRAVKKEQKHYQVDWSLVEESGPRFENLVASHLLKWVHFQHDAYGRNLDLKYFRDVDRREVDFVVTETQQPVAFIEAKVGANTPSQTLLYLKKRFPAAKAFQISLTDDREQQARGGIHLMPARKFLSLLV